MAADLIFYTDSSGKTCAGVWKNEWFFHDFSAENNEKLPFIHHKELFSLVAVARTWGHALSKKTILIYCDNSASVEAITTGRCSDVIMMKLIRELHYVCASFSFQVKALHIPGKLNVVADALSRSDLRATAWSHQLSLDRVPVNPDLPTMNWF